MAQVTANFSDDTLSSGKGYRPCTDNSDYIIRGCREWNRLIGAGRLNAEAFAGESRVLRSELAKVLLQ